MFTTITKSMNKIDRIINIIRELNEEAPTMSLGAGKIAGTAEAGDQPPVRNRYLYLGKKSRTPWMRKDPK
jgi:hypothetical protein